MEWTVTNVVIQIFAGILGGHAAAVAANEHSFGALGNTIAVAWGGAISGYFLQTLAAAVVTGSGAVQGEPDLVTQWVLQGLTGLVAGAIITLVIGLLKHITNQHSVEKTNLT